MCSSPGRRRSFRSTLTVGALAGLAALIASPHRSYAQTDVFASVRESGSIVSGEQLVELSIPKGRYALLAKINIDQDAKRFVTVVCTIWAGKEVDRNVIRLQPSSVTYLDNVAVPLQAVVDLDVNYEIFVSCSFDPQSDPLSFRFAKLTAIRVDGILCEEPTPARCPPPLH